MNPQLRTHRAVIAALVIMAAASGVSLSAGQFGIFGGGDKDTKYKIYKDPAGRFELDRPKRRAIYSQVQKILAHDLPVVPLWHEDNVAAMRKIIRGFEILPTAQLSSLSRTWKEE